MSLVRKTTGEEIAANWFLESDRHFAALFTDAHLGGSYLGHLKSAGKSRLFECTENLALSSDSSGTPPHDNMRL